jgi:hypothetical protein
VYGFDGLLVWMHKPSKQDIKLTKIGAKKFFVEEKQFGLNM